MEQPFTYSPLPSNGWFRLLSILPSHDETSDISCELHHHELSTCPQYEAISYTWGNEDARERLLVNGTVFKVRPNLHAALRAFRQPHEAKLIWVDAVCINQQDQGERNRQVLQMNQIYSQAQVVDVWLGTANTTSDAGVAFLTTFYTLVYHDTNYQQSPSRDARTASIYPDSTPFHEFYAPILKLLDEPRLLTVFNHAVAFLANSWWRRIWTLQESVLCPNVICWSGSKTFPFEYLLGLSHFLYHLVNHDAYKGALAHRDMTLGALMLVEYLRKDMVARRGIGLTMALYSTWNRASSDPRDKVIGLLGIIEPRDSLKPEYSWPVEKVYRVAMRAALVEDGNLNCLGLISEKKESRNKNLASWVPDFELHSEPFKDYITSLSKVLNKWSIYKTFMSPERSLPDITTDEDDSETQAMAFWRTVLVDLNQGRLASTKGGRPKRLDKNDLQDLLQLETPEGMEGLLSTWESCLRPIYRQLRLIEQFNRRFFRTEKGYMGLGPPDIQPGDTICLLLGGCVAYALRRSAQETWIYVGECYIHGIMDGEAAVNATDDKTGFAEYRIV
ncbi:heterokaryon incompatibility protein-domain-containing protein [Fusarium oxysporum II5]|uniref:Heterokaryon incompatibility protein 6, OR allele n=1 Tax=Fusarium oxysporum f. sp. cubense (strain race 4) TaxID=2502994 RepID=N1S3M2_FUSC4|nr:Heterokaryon incompatibility protein 6, OR allele [Fusarium odoratissimum]KAK2124763.1 heterokaryon incompatibility protein-domain-containing protein [Fusarium oxysporum II5]